MIFEDFYKELTRVDASIISRETCANLILDDTTLIPYLISILFMIEDKTSCRAAWVLEFICKKNIALMAPFLNEFTLKLKSVQLDSAVRPVSKISFLIAEAFYSKNDNVIKISLTPPHRERIIEACFDWLIGDEKVAAKVFAMQTLFLFGQDENWIHPELKLLIEQDFTSQSAAYKSRAKHILKKLKKANRH